MEESKALVPFAETQSLAKAFHQSGMFPDVKSESQGIVKIVAGRELGLGPVYSMQRLYMIEGKLGMAAETMGALIKRSGKYNYVVAEHTDLKCAIDFFEGAKKVYISTFTMNDAKRANLIKPNGGWMKYPRALLFSRALSQGARIVAPDVIGGAYTEEELRSIQPEGNGEPTTLPTEIRVVEPSEEAPEGSPQGEQSAETSQGTHSWNTTCPQHDVQWFKGPYGMAHKLEDGKNYCNANNLFKRYWEKLLERVGMAYGEGNDWLKENYQVTWSKLTHEQMIEAIFALKAKKESREAPAEQPIPSDEEPPVEEMGV